MAFKPTRREFVKVSAMAGAGVLLARNMAWAFYQTPTTIPLFGTTLRGVGPGGIPVAAPDKKKAPVTGVTHYTMDINQFIDAGVCPTVGGTTLWGFNPAVPLGGGTQAQKHLGGVIVAQRNQPIQITFRNNLSSANGVTKHIVPNDLTLNFQGDGFNRTAIHFHGGFIPWVSDGGPFDWWDPAGNHGPIFMNNQVFNPGAAANEAEYYWSMNLSARMMWFHDHAHGITRLNAYAGIATALIIRDPFEIGLKNLGLPEFVEAGGNEIPLVFQDKTFVGSNLAAVDPTYEGLTTPGSLWYPHIYERSRWKNAGNVSGGNLVPPDPSCVPEAFQDTMLVNGTAYPTVQVEPRRYRLRLLNACNARFLNLQLFVDDGSPNGITLNAATGLPTNSPALCNPNSPGVSASFLQIGAEGGFLPYPVNVPSNIPFNPVNPLSSSLVVSPAERPDILVDFSHHAGQNIILYNDAPAPFPVGDPRNDYFPGFNVKANPVNGLTPNGYGPNTRVLMRFEVAKLPTSADAPLQISTSSDFTGGIDTPLVAPFGVTTPPPGATTRQLTLNETYDAYGRLIQMLGTLLPLTQSGGYGRPFDTQATEVIPAGTTEVWELFNVTGDVHPIHFHLVNVQVLNRQPFQVSSLGSTKDGANFTGPAVGPQPNETGWKETVSMVPGTVTRIIMRFDLPTIVGANGLPLTTVANPKTGQLAITNGVPPLSYRPNGGGTAGGHEYVYHCHILEHEEHDMMRPLIVT